jgi:hypothetical protein
MSDGISLVSKSVTKRDSAYENRWDAAASCKVKNIFVNGSRRGLLDSRFRIQFQKASDFSFPTKSLNFLRKGQSRRYWSVSQGIENSLSWQLVAAAIQFSQTLQGNSRHYGNFQRAVFGFSYFKVCCRFWEKGKFDGTSMKFGLSLIFLLPQGRLA